MRKIHHIALLAFDGIQILDVTGPAAVFGAANDAAEKPFYQVHILSAGGGTVTSNCGVALMTSPLSSLKPASVDMAFIPGGTKEGLTSLALNDTARAWMQKASTRARRYGSICTGTFPLAYFGLVKGKRVATHWQATDILRKFHPDLDVDANAVYVEDGGVWTSAGVTTGIDMSLALVARDLGEQVANIVAKRLVLYARRPGYQSQFSPVLAAQAKANGDFAELIHWIREHMDQDLDVTRLAERVAMSTRNFHRKFTEAIGETPAHFIETVRLDHSRHLLSTAAPLKEIAAKTGYSTQGQFSKAFVRRFGMSPGLFREMHHSQGR